ncbi:dipeptide ABC transporter ATP-binding protein [Nonomuraea sp. NPDC050451]|uniref:dipeptide ABC transporter ATP-binding protein n=1 Tax=Nonomuraea sp. NPDC050451 TaxID=3364364 RepID=UPI0037B97DCD
MTPAAKLLDVEDLRVSFRGGVAVEGVSFSIAPGECLALVGESGSGKSVTARALVGLAGRGARVRAARLSLDGQDLRGHRSKDWRRLRGRRIGLVLQDALTALDPLRTVGAEVAEGLRAHRLAPRGEVAERVTELLAAAGVPNPAERRRKYPHQLSGGLRQRALIAGALAAGPDLLIADEPTTALDVSVQARILDLLAERRAAGTALLLISHDLAVVARLADRIAVMRAGRIVELGPAREVLSRPEHPYTRELLAAVPSAAPRPARAFPGPAVLSVREVGKRFADGTTALEGVSLDVSPGEIVGLVGESGSGKTTLARVALGLLAPDGGEVLLGGEPWSGLSERERRPLRHRVGVVWQDPLSSLDPRYTVAKTVGEAVAAARRAFGTPGEARTAASTATRAAGRVEELLAMVGLGPELSRRRPHQLSGGQRQRVAIARALAAGPSLLICDEPVSALDVSIQAQVLDLLLTLRDELGLAMLFISHDLAVIRQVSDRVAVMRAGRVVESGHAADVFAAPRHAYTRELLRAVPAVTPPALGPAPGGGDALHAGT